MSSETAALTVDAFASTHLGFRVYRLSRPESACEVLSALAGEPGPLMVEAKVPSDRVSLVGALTDLGFWIVDTNVQLDAPAATLRAAVSPSAAWRVRDATPADQQAVARIVVENMTTSRYHLDPRIDPQRASALKRAWVGNFFAGLRGQRLVVAESDAGVSGFLLVLESGGRGVIDLIAVDPPLRGTGVTAGLIGAWLERSSKVARVLVGTQISNLRSLKAYGRLGFRVCGASYVLHYLRDGAHTASPP